MVDQVLRFTRYTAAFEKMAAEELRLLVHEAPAVAECLTELASQLDRHADQAQALPSRLRAIPGRTG